MPKKKIKAWAIIDKKGKIVFNLNFEIYPTKKEAVEYLDEEEYIKVVPCEIILK